MLRLKIEYGEIYREANGYHSECNNSVVYDTVKVKYVDVDQHVELYDEDGELDIDLIQRLYLKRYVKDSHCSSEICDCGLERIVTSAKFVCPF